MGKVAGTVVTAARVVVGMMVVVAVVVVVGPMVVGMMVVVVAANPSSVPVPQALARMQIAAHVSARRPRVPTSMTTGPLSRGRRSL
jgi:hypothetical protein